MEGRQCEVEGIQRIALPGPQTRPLRLFATALSRRSVPRLIFRVNPMRGWLRQSNLQCA